MKILNLFAGIGGNRTLWGNKHDITAIENNQQIACVYYKRFPKDKIIIGDAYEYLLWNYDKFDFIWASPPCQTHSWANNWLHVQNVRRYPDMGLWQIIIFLRKFCKSYWIVENVRPYYENHIKPNFILGRHYFWSNIIIPSKGFQYSDITVINAKNSHRRDNKTYLKDLANNINIELDFLNQFNFRKWPNHDAKGQILRNAIKPELGKLIIDSIKIKKQMTII